MPDKRNNKRIKRKSEMVSADVIAGRTYSDIPWLYSNTFTALFATRILGYSYFVQLCPLVGNSLDLHQHRYTCVCNDFLHFPT